MRKLTQLALTIVMAMPQLALALPEPLDTAEVAAEQRWRMPLDKARVSSFFGARRGHHAHEGIDFSVPIGTLVTATDGGTVIASGTHYGGDRKYGNVIVIEHDNGLRSLYAHLNQRDVSVGDVVSSGERIGLSGNTGRSTGPHLHLEAWRNKSRIDPKALLLANLNEHALPSALRSPKKKAAFAAKSSKGRKRA